MATHNLSDRALEVRKQMIAEMIDSGVPFEKIEEWFKDPVTRSVLNALAQMISDNRTPWNSEEKEG